MDIEEDFRETKVSRGTKDFKDPKEHKDSRETRTLEETKVFKGTNKWLDSSRETDSRVSNSKVSKDSNSRIFNSSVFNSKYIPRDSLVSNHSRASSNSNNSSRDLKFSKSLYKQSLVEL